MTTIILCRAIAQTLLSESGDGSLTHSDSLKGMY